MKQKQKVKFSKPSRVMTELTKWTDSAADPIKDMNKLLIEYRKDSEKQFILYFSDLAYAKFLPFLSYNIYGLLFIAKEIIIFPDKRAIIGIGDKEIKIWSEV